MKRVGLLLASCIWLFAGCAKKDTKINLVWYQWFDAETQRSELTPVIEEFEKAHPNVHIEMAAISNGSYWDRLALDISSGVEGDIVTLDTGAGLYGYYSQREGGAFLPLDNYIKGKVLDDGTNLEKDVYLIDSVKIDGKIVGLPYIMFSAPMTAYSKSKLAAAGLTPDDLSTWDKYSAACKKLTVDNNGDGKIDVYGWGHPALVETISRWWHMHWLWTAGGGIFPKEQGPYTPDRLIFNCPENVKAVTWMKDLYDAASPQGQKSLGDLHAMFTNGTVATCQAAVWTVTNFKSTMTEDQFKNDLGFVPFPAYSADKQPVLVSWGNPVAISTKCKHPDEAFEFCAYLHSKYAQKMAMRRAAPTNKLVYDDYAAVQPEQAAFIQSCQKYEMRNVPDIKQWNEFDHILQEAISSALTGTKSVKEALDWGQKEMTKALQAD